METNKLQEQHNRLVQEDIDTERAEINRLKQERNKYAPEIQNLEWRLSQINTEVRKIEIDMDVRENRIKILSDRFWK